MIKNNIYKYIGRNGIITSKVILDGINRLEFYELRAEEGKILTNGKRQSYSVIIEKENLNDWSEITDNSNKEE